MAAPVLFSERSLGAPSRTNRPLGVSIATIKRLAPYGVILTGVHQPGESHFDLMKAFANDDRLARIGAAAEERGYRSHEFGDSLLIERGEEAA